MFIAVSDFGARKKKSSKPDTSATVFLTPPRQRSNPPLPGHRKQSNCRGLLGRGGHVEVSIWSVHNCEILRELDRGENYVKGSLMLVYATALICSTGVLGFHTFKLMFFIYNKLHLHAELLKASDPLTSLFAGSNSLRSNWSVLNVSNDRLWNPKLTLEVNGRWIKSKLKILPVRC